jgi:short-subunit dehydrogenase
LAPTSKPVTLITGASAGIGLALARLFAARGHECALVARREAQLNALADEIARSGRLRPHVLALDLTAPDAGERVAKELAVRGLEPAIVINNAGFGLRGDAADLDCGEQLAMIDLNARALTDLSLRFVASLKRHSGGVINIASLSGFMPGPGMAVYFAGKAFVVRFSDALAREFRPLGIKVTCVCPGPVPTEFQGRAGLGEDHLPRFLTLPAERIAQDAYDAFVRGRRLVVPGFANKVVTVLARFLPRGFVLSLAATYQMKAAPPKPTNR